VFSETHGIKVSVVRRKLSRRNADVKQQRLQSVSQARVPHTSAHYGEFSLLNPCGKFEIVLILFFGSLFLLQIAA
jgi:hypothetical protein